jgi:hypothetical protein
LTYLSGQGACSSFYFPFPPFPLSPRRHPTYFTAAALAPGGSIAVVISHQVEFLRDRFSASVFLSSPNTPQRPWHQRGQHRRVSSSDHNRRALLIDLAPPARTGSRDPQQFHLLEALMPSPVRSLKDSSLDHSRMHLMFLTVAHIPLTSAVRIPITSFVAVQEPPPTPTQQLIYPLQTPPSRTPMRFEHNGWPKARSLARRARRANASIHPPVAVGRSKREQGSQPRLSHLVARRDFLRTTVSYAENHTLGLTKMAQCTIPR